MRVPPSAVGVYEQTNVEMGLVAYLNDSKMYPNTISPSAYAFSQFLQLGALLSASNYLEQVIFTERGECHRTLPITSAATAPMKPWASASRLPIWLTHSTWTRLAPRPLLTMSYFQPACAGLSNLCALGIIEGLSYIEAGTGNVLLSNIQRH